MQLFTRYQNSAGERVRIALNLKGLVYDYVSIDSLAPGEYLQLNPQGLMPTLRVGERSFPQATAILEYLEETYPEHPLLPADPIARGQARGFAQLITSEVHAINVTRVRKYLSTQVHADEAALAAWTRHWISTAFAALETTLANRERATDFCFGETPGWADLHLAPQMANARRSGCDLDPYPLLRAVDERCQALDAFRLARPEAQPDYPG